MVITIKTQFGTEHDERFINLELIDDKLSLQTVYTDYRTPNLNNECTAIIDKKELHDLIGALLHLQSKLNQKK